MGTYNEIWVWLNRPDLTPIPQHLLHGKVDPDFSACLQHFKENSASKTINLRALTRTDDAYLAAHGISRRHLARNLMKTVCGRQLYSRAFQVTAIQKHAVYAFSPFSGKLLESDRSLLANINVIFYRFQDEQVFYIASAGIGRGFPKSAVYFPRQDLIVTTGEPWTVEEDDVIELKARMTSSAELCCEYLSDGRTRGRKMVVCVGSYHFAHHLWNELSGIYRLYRRGLLNKVDKYLVMREPLGAITEIFPEILPEKVDRKNSTKALFEDILRNRYFAVRAGDNFIASDLADRVFRVALENCLPATIGKIAYAKKEHYPLLWVGIRIGTRSWANQVDGLSSVIDSLLSDFPRLGVVFDGFSLPGDRCAEGGEYAEVIRQENEVVMAIIERLERHRTTPGIFNIVGSSIFDANVWAHAVNFYISPYGTIQHKIGWLTKKPGIIHTNQTLLKNPSRHVWSVNENAIKPRYVGSDAVKDIRGKKSEAVIYRRLRDLGEAGAGLIAGVERVQGDPEFDNYVVDWRSLRDQISDLMNLRPIAGRLAPSGLIDWPVTKLTRTLQTILDRWDINWSA